MLAQAKTVCWCCVRRWLSALAESLAGEPLASGTHRTRGSARDLLDRLRKRAGSDASANTRCQVKTSCRGLCYTDIRQQEELLEDHMSAWIVSKRHIDFLVAAIVRSDAVPEAGWDR